jgi:hypothetical protein
MDNEEITIWIHDTGTISVEFGRLPKARQHWDAPGLTVYTKGSMPFKLYPVICNIAMNECIARHIPAKSLRRIISDVHRSVDTKPEAQRELPGIPAGHGNREGRSKDTETL